MDKDSILELQLIDTNCNDCAFMTRDPGKLKESQQNHYEWQLKEFERAKKRLIDSALEYRRKNELEKYNDLLVQAEKMKFQFDKKEASIHFGICSKFNKGVSFIPNHCTPENSVCFQHRRL